MIPGYELVLGFIIHGIVVFIVLGDQEEFECKANVLRDPFSVIGTVHEIRHCLLCNLNSLTDLVLNIRYSGIGVFPIKDRDALAVDETVIGFI
jgi:hypothetical protein